MKLFISFLVAAVIVASAIALLLIGKGIAYRYGYDFLCACVTACMIIALLTAYIYSLC